MVRTRAVYISDSTELGTVYTKQELEELYEFCQSNELILFMDGARLPMALTSPSNDMTLTDIARLTDVFYIGGTKCGALLGEAIVIVNENFKKDFKYYLKQRGALMAKGRIIGIQFDELLKNNLIFDMAKHANSMAEKMATAFEALGYPMLMRSDTNQIFPVLPNGLITQLQKKYSFYIWSVVNTNYSAIRLITSWATPEKMVSEFIDDLKEMSIDY